MSCTAVQAVVHGRVQGVGFRYHTQREAIVLRLNGWVRNRRDGAVEVYAEGTIESIDDFIEYLKRGPSFAHVTNVDIRRPKCSGVFNGFEIEY